MGDERTAPEKNGRFHLRDAIQLLGPLFLVGGFLIHLGGTINRIETSISELRVGQERIAAAVEPDIADGIRREVRVTAIERRIDACCPYTRR